MKDNKATSVEEYKIVSSFQSLRKMLLEEKYADRLEKPLAYWALPNDRRLPLAFLGRTIKDLLSTPFEELSATPGIGQKKISSLVKLLSRATKDQPPTVPFGMAELSDGPRSTVTEKARHPSSEFDPTVVSEALWAQWRDTVKARGAGGEKLGRLAPTLQALPTVIWHSTLENYVNYTVAEIRQLKTHGEKRVRVVLEAFYIVHELLAGAGRMDHLAIRLVPRFIIPIEEWIVETLRRPGVPSSKEINDHLTVPLLSQIKIDAGDTIYELSAGRLGIDSPAQSVRQQAKQMGVTRARIYQLLEDCGKVMEVRWPEGDCLLAALKAKLHAEATDKNHIQSFCGVMDLFYPGKNKLADEDANDNDS